MRISLKVALLAAMLMASPLAIAQRVSLADRLAALEQRAANDQGGTELVNQISQLRSEVQDLRGQIEVLQQQLEQGKQSQRSQYLDLDGRLNRLEGGTPSTSTTTPEAIPAPASSPGSDEVIAGSPSVPVAGTTATDERGAYANAFDALKSGDYAESARRFRDFLSVYPDGEYAPNGMYWLGESYYVTQNYAMAGEQFQRLLDRYSSHDKAPGALLKLGLSNYGLKQYDDAEIVLREVLRRYPGTDVARTADDRLRAIALTRGR
ncbi:MAG: tol-pal system protein YbgF [Pseudomonadota bacterium]|nr:tol-pal system protein YbgF [Pseudomonadota bacterium]